MHVPETNLALIETLKRNLKPEIRLVEVDAHINDRLFAEKAAILLDELMHEARRHRMLPFVSSIPKNNYIASLQIVRQELARAYPMVLHMLMLDEMGVEIIAVWDATADYASTVPVSPST